MAVFANVTRIDVRRRLARRLDAVMAVDAGARNADVIKVRWQPARRRVAVVAVVAAVDMTDVLALCGYAIVTIPAEAENLEVINGIGRRPGVRAVAVLADLRRLQVIEWLAFGFGAVVARHAVVDDVRVIEIGGQPARRCMAVVAAVAAVNMVGIFAHCCQAVVTGAAQPEDLQVIDGKCRYPDIRAVAVLADIRALDVVRILAGRLRTVMTVEALAGNVHVIEIGGQPGDRGMAIVTIVAALDMG